MMSNVRCGWLGIALLLVCANASAAPDAANKPAWARCLRPVASKNAPTPYLADLALAGEWRQRRECLDASPSKQPELLAAREEAQKQHIEVITRIFIRDREALPEPPRVSENGWPRLVRTDTFDAQQRLLQSSGAQIIAGSTAEETVRWSVWSADPAKDTALYYFVEAVMGDRETRFVQIALTPATHAPLWRDSLQRRLDGKAQAPKQKSSSSCLFDLAATKDEFIYKDGQVLSLAEGDRAIVMLSSGKSAQQSLAAHLSQAHAQAPEAMDRFDKLVALSKVPGPQSPGCAALKDHSVTRTLGMPGMTRAQFRQLWHGLNGGMRALGGHDFDVLPEFTNDRLSALDITPARTFEAGDQPGASAKPSWTPRNHDEAEALLSRGLGQLAYRQAGRDEDGAEVIRSVWRFGHGIYAVLTNLTAAGATVSMTARMAKGVEQTLSPEPRAQRQAEAQRPWRLLVFHAFRPGILSLCENAHRWPGFERLAMPDPADPLKARWLDEAASIEWRGGTFSQSASTANAADAPTAHRLLSDACFTLFVDGAPVISGAIVQSFSARRFEFPALVIERRPAGAPLALTLAPGFPVQAEQPVPAAWAELLKGLAKSAP